jgi:hypothetical protein
MSPLRPSSSGALAAIAASTATNQQLPSWPWITSSGSTPPLYTAGESHTTS